MSGLKSHISNLKSKSFAVIVAGGSGSRMQSALPKQFLPVNGRPLMMYTIEAFAASEYVPQILVVLPASYHDHWKQLCAGHKFETEHFLVAGGETRFHSVKNAIDQISDKNVLIAVHDAVRPLINREAIDQAYTTAAELGSAVVAVKSRDSVRQQKGEISRSVDRNEIYLVQTPQTFQSEILRAAYEQPFDDLSTDDASVVERAGTPITLVQGNYANIKITFPEDLAIAEALLSKKPPL